MSVQKYQNWFCTMTKKMNMRIDMHKRKPTCKNIVCYHLHRQYLTGQMFHVEHLHGFLTLCDCPLILYLPECENHHLKYFVNCHGLNLNGSKVTDLSKVRHLDILIHNQLINGEKPKLWNIWSIFFSQNAVCKNWIRLYVKTWQHWINWLIIWLNYRHKYEMMNLCCGGMGHIVTR